MTSILKQNTSCFALPLCRLYRRQVRAGSNGKRGRRYLERYSVNAREDVLESTIMSASDGGSLAALTCGMSRWSDRSAGDVQLVADLA
jgi:hypothetical protein